MKLHALVTTLAVTFALTPAHARHHHHRYHRSYSSNSGVVGGRPSGCPNQYCGCGSSIYLFGRIIPTLNLASNWFRFPRSYPAPRMAAVRPGHVMVLVEPRGGSNWLVYDSNSGSHLTRLHERSIAGYRIVNPHAI